MGRPATRPHSSRAASVVGASAATLTLASFIAIAQPTVEPFADAERTVTAASEHGPVAALDFPLVGGPLGIPDIGVVAPGFDDWYATGPGLPLSTPPAKAQSQVLPSTVSALSPSVESFPPADAAPGEPSDTVSPATPAPEVPAAAATAATPTPADAPSAQPVTTPSESTSSPTSPTSTASSTTTDTATPTPSTPTPSPTTPSEIPPPASCEVDPTVPDDGTETTPAPTDPAASTEPDVPTTAPCPPSCPAPEAVPQKEEAQEEIDGETPAPEGSTGTTNDGTGAVEDEATPPATCAPAPEETPADSTVPATTTAAPTP